MSVRSLNKVTLIGNLTRDPELRYTPAGTAVCTLGVATNRSWTTQTGETKEETEFHRIVAWNKLAELCSQLLAKGRKVYVEGRLATHSWTAQDGAQRTTTEIVIDDMIILDSKRPVKEESPVNKEGGVLETQVNATDTPFVPEEGAENVSDKKTEPKSEDNKKPRKKAAEKKEEVKEEVTPDDIPF